MVSSSSLSFTVWIMIDGVSYLSFICFAVWGSEEATTNPLRKHLSLGFFTYMYNTSHTWRSASKIMTSTWFDSQVKLRGQPKAAGLSFAATAIIKVIILRRILENVSHEIPPLWGWAPVFLRNKRVKHNNRINGVCDWTGVFELSPRNKNGDNRKYPNLPIWLVAHYLGSRHAVLRTIFLRAQNQNRHCAVF